MSAVLVLEIHEKEPSSADNMKVAITIRRGGGRGIHRGLVGENERRRKSMMGCNAIIHYTTKHQEEQLFSTRSYLSAGRQAFIIHEKNNN